MAQVNQDVVRHLERRTPEIQRATVHLDSTVIEIGAAGPAEGQDHRLRRDPTEPKFPAGRRGTSVSTRAARQHDALRKKMGITQEQDEEWQRTHETPAEARVKGAKSVNPFAVGGGFLAWCVQQGWLIQRGRQYFATTEGARELRERLGIKL